MALDLLLIQCPCWTITHPPMHLAILKAAVQAAGYTCHCWDLSLQLYRRLTAADRVRWRNEDVGFWMSPEAVAALQQRHDAFLQQMLLAVQRKRPRIIGFSAQVTTREFAVQLARRCKQLLPEIPIVFGGIEARSCCSGWRLAAEPAIDYVISGEADGALPALLEALHGRRDLATVPGLLREYQGVRQAVPEQPLAELDAAPFPDYRDFVLADYENPHGLDVIFSRGCVNQCAYCIESVLGKTYRSKSGDYLFREVAHYRALFPELRELRFSDAAMNGNIREVREFCERLRQLAVPFTWTGNLIALRNMDREMVNLLRAAGCRAVEIGIESGSPRVQKLMRKHLDLAHAERLIAELAAAGIAVAVNFMAGFPGESEADFRQTLRFFRRVAPWLARVNLWHEGTMLFRGSSMFNRVEEYGIVLDDPGFTTPATVWWHTADGENTLGVRQRRFDALRRLARRYALTGIATDTDEQALFLAIHQDYTRRCAAATARWSDSYYRWVYALRVAWWFPEQEAHLRLPGLPGLVGRWQRWRQRWRTWPEQVRHKQETALRVGGMLSERQAYTGPFHAQIDLTNRCTNQCLVCWFRSPLLGTAAQGYAVRDRELPTAMAERLLHDLAQLHCHEVHFSGGGDPFSHAACCGLIERARQEGLAVRLTCNGRGLHPPVIDRLLVAGLEQLTVSLWAASASTYTATHPGTTVGDYLQLIENMRHLHARRTAAGVKYLTITNVIFRTNFHEIPQMVTLAAELGADQCNLVLFDPILPAYQELLIDGDAVVQLRQLLGEAKRLGEKYRLNMSQLDTWLQRLDHPQDAVSGEYDRHAVNAVPCYSAWQNCRILADGGVVPCYSAFDKPLGNLHQRDFAQIWFSPAFDEFRRNCRADKVDNPFFAPCYCYKTCDHFLQNRMLASHLANLGLLKRALLRVGGRLLSVPVKCRAGMQRGKWS